MHASLKRTRLGRLRSSFRVRSIWATTASAACCALVANVALPCAAAAEVTGSLKIEQGVPVLRLWGDARARGHAHGYLLADSIVGFFEDVLFDPRVMPDAGKYESAIRRQFLGRMRFSPTETDELAGMMDGLRDRLGPQGLILKRLQRPIDAEDLEALNTLSDWVPTACSSFAAWGPATADNGTVVARNLDYFDLPGVTEQHLIIAYVENRPAPYRFVSTAWPGLIGAYTAMNEEGLFIAMHDAPAPKAEGAPYLVPRSLVMRRILESVSIADCTQQATELLRNNPTYRGNNFLLAAPYTGQFVPAAVFEYDGDTSVDRGVTVRMPDCTTNQTPPHTIACTNHYRLRSPPASCNRYESLIRHLRNVDLPDGALDAAAAFEAIKSTTVRGTLHTVIALPNKKELLIHLATPQRPATQNAAHHFKVADLLQKGG